MHLYIIRDKWLKMQARCGGTKIEATPPGLI